MSSKWRNFKRFTLFVTFIINLANLVTNWLLYNDIIRIEPGLIFGPYSPAFRHTVLVLCILSTLVNLIEISSIYVELFRKEKTNCWLSGNTTSAMAIWLDDLPKAGIMLYIVACHDRAISIFEIVRACLLLSTVIIRLLAFVIRETCVRRRQSSGLPTREEIMYRRRSCRGCGYGFITVGLLLKVVAFIVIYFFTFFQTYHGDVTYKLPRGIITPSPNYEKYITNTSIYMNFGSDGNDAWMELLPMQSIVFEKQCTIDVDILPASVKLTTQCGQFEKTTRTVSLVKKRESEGLKTMIGFRFRFIRPTSSLLLGNIEYTMKQQQLNDDEVESSKNLKYFCREYSKESGGGAGLINLIIPITEKYDSVPSYGTAKEILALPGCLKTGQMKCPISGLDGPLFVDQLSA